MRSAAQKTVTLDPDVDLVRRIRSGDHTAFSELFMRYHQHLCSFAYSFVESSDVAQDLVQDVFANLWRLRAEWQPGGTVRGYLYRAVRNGTISHHEHRAVQMDHRQAYDKSENRPVTPLENLSYAELAEEIQDAIRDLPERRRHIFVLNRIHRLTYAEIATALDISENTVDTQMRRALATLRSRFEVYLR
jgi:RNA polymerase sigma-70 factor, ECF subfamily